MSRQSSVSHRIGEDLDALFETLIDFDTSHREWPDSDNNGMAGQCDYNAEQNTDADKTKVLTIRASIDAIYRHLKTERNKGNERPSVAIKLKDLTQRKSITFSIPALHSPTSTVASSVGSQSRAPSLSPSPEVSTREDISTAFNETASVLAEEETSPTEENMLHIIASPSARRGACSFPTSGDVLPNAVHFTGAAVPAQATRSQSGIMSARSTSSRSPVASEEGLISGPTQHHSRVPTKQVVASAVEMDQEISPHTTSFRSIRSRQAGIASQRPAAALSKEKSSAISNTTPKKGSRSCQKRYPLEGVPNESLKRPRVEILDLAALLPEKDIYKKVQELTVNQDLPLTLKMVRNARAILPLSEMEDRSLSTATNVDAIAHSYVHHPPSTPEDVTMQFCAIIRKIELVERLAFQSMVEYRVLFVKLYQQYLLLQKVVVTAKGERRVTLAKGQLYKMLYPNIAKTRNGRTSDEWEKFNRCIRRAKQWSTIASELGVEILHRMPSCIRHTWVEQKLQTKDQLHIWIKIVRLLT